MAKSSKAESAEPAEPETPETAPSKGRATPTRKEQEAANRRPLVQGGRQTAEQRAAVKTQRARAQAGIAAGEERYLPPRDKGPQKRYVRDFVDARWNVGELLMPLLVAVILTYFFPDIASYALIGAWGLIVLVLVDCVVLRFQLHKRLAEKFGGKDKVERGVAWYAAMRAIQLRVLRMPKPQVRRGEYPR